MHQTPPDSPSDDAYGRVTAPERYRVLHEVASAVLDMLVTQYDVERQRLHETRLGDEESVQRLVPAGGGAPLEVAFTCLPGLRARFGEWRVEDFPSCACDACDEQPRDVANDFRWKVDAVVAGDFGERLRRFPRPSLTYEFEPGNPGWNRLTHVGLRSLGKPGFRQWQPWPRR